MPPVHPGKVLKDIYLEPLGLGQGEAADNLGVTRKTLSLLINEHQGISAEMALRLSKAFDTSPELWMNMQRNYDLWNAGKKITPSALTQIKHFTTKKRAVVRKPGVAKPKKSLSSKQNAV